MNRYPYVREIVEWLRQRDQNAQVIVDGPKHPCIVVMEGDNGTEFNTDRLERD